MLLPYPRYWVFFGSSLVAVDELPLPLPLGVAVEPLGWVVLLAPLLALGALELVSVELDELEVAPPEADPVADFSFSLSFSASVVAELELEALGALDAPADGLVALDDEELGALGLVALGEVLLELELPALGELGGVDGVTVVLLLLEPDAPGAVDVRSRFSPQAASPSAIATAIANVESLMCSSRVEYKAQVSKYRTGYKALIRKGLHPVRRTLCLLR